MAVPVASARALVGAFGSLARSGDDPSGGPLAIPLGPAGLVVAGLSRSDYSPSSCPRRWSAAPG